MNRASLVALATGLAALAWAPHHGPVATSSAPAAFTPPSPPAAETAAAAHVSPPSVARAARRASAPLSDPTPAPAVARPRMVAAGMTAAVDPATGRPIEPTSKDLQEILEASLPDFNTSATGLVEVDSPVKNGGVLVRLDGRFMNSMVQTIGPDGQPQSTCGAHVPAAAPAARED